MTFILNIPAAAILFHILLYFAAVFFVPNNFVIKIF